ncbi:MAG TPA: cyclic nucleotide-binding domain-containing protein, partial [Gemmatimonadales bacterium]
MTTDLDVAFPTLTEEDLAVLETRGRRRDAKTGEVLFRAGDRGFCFYVVLDGAIDIMDTSREEAPLIVTHRAGQFSGDVDSLSGRVAVVTARVAEDSRLLELSAEELRRAVDEVPRLTDTIVRAFLMRRQLLLSSGFALVEIIGSRYS